MRPVWVGDSVTSGAFDRRAVCPPAPYDAPPSGEIQAVAIEASLTVADGFESQIFEGPVWLDGSLYFSNMFDRMAEAPSNIRRFTPPNTIEDFILNSGTNGMALDPDGNLVVGSQGTQSIARFNLAAKERTEVVTMVEGMPFNAPNDVVIRSDGIIYFTDPLWQNNGRPSVGETKVYVVSGATVTGVDTPFVGAFSMGGPNGIMLSLDETVLYVAGSSTWPPQIVSYPVAADGSLGAYTQFAEATSGGDGMALDCAGNLYVTEGSSVEVYSPDGAKIASISVPAGLTTNAAFGGEDLKTLFITTYGIGIPQLNSVELPIPGLPY